MKQHVSVALAIVVLASAPHAAPQRPGGPGGMAGQERKLLAQFDKDGDKRLNADERKAALAFLESDPNGGMRGGGRRGGGGMTPGTAGAKMSPADVKNLPNAPLYDLSVVRTLFLQFEDADWERELMAFNNTDIEVSATLIADGRKYNDVGIHFRGMSSFFAVPAGLKHSINVSIDWVHDAQALDGYRTLNLLNSHEDPTFLRTVLFLGAAREYVPAPKANYVRVVLNGEYWGVYVNAEQFNKDFVKEWFNTTDGARWKVPGSPGGRGGLEYLGEDANAYKRIYEIKSKDDPKSWAALIRMTKILNETPPEKLEQALAPVLDIDGALKFLALEATLVNNDGYWVRASDYSIYLDVNGRFHVMPHDANETFGPGGGRGRMGPPPPGMRGGVPGPPDGGRPGRGPGGPGGPGGFGMMGGGPDLDPLVGLNDAGKPLRSKLLAVPALRAKYLTYVRTIAAKWLDWNTLNPLVTKYQALIAADVKADTRKLDSFEDFQAGVTSLKNFVDRRRAYLAAYKPPQ
jgi:spore coat protein CotH